MRKEPSEQSQAPRGKYVGAGAPQNDNAPVYTLTRSELSELVRAAVAAAVGQSGPRLVDKQELACSLGCSPAHVDNLRKRGLPWVPVGQTVRFEANEVIKWLREQQEGTQ